jgi:polysaccharide export outer membrane protein
MARQRGPIQRGEYRLMAGDKLNIKFPFHHARDQELPVRPDGKISLDVTGEILAEGLTPMELAEIIKERSSRYLKKPEVVVIVTGIGDRRVYVGGEVNRPGFVVIQEGMTPLQAVMAVGGFKDTAQKTDVLYIARASNGDYNASRVDLDDVVRNGTPEVARLAGNDIVYVPATRIVNAGIFVKQYIRDMLPVESKAGASAALPGL